jgi:hypothetical protein
MWFGVSPLPVCSPQDMTDSLALEGLKVSTLLQDSQAPGSRTTWSHTFIDSPMISGLSSEILIESLYPVSFNLKKSNTLTICPRISRWDVLSWCLCFCIPPSNLISNQLLGLPSFFYFTLYNMWTVPHFLHCPKHSQKVMVCVCVPDC